MKVLVTGAYGQLGNEIKEQTENFPGWNFLFTDIDTLDIADESAVSLFLKKNCPDFIINCAAYTAVDKAETEKNTAEKINAEAPGILAKLAKYYNAGFIHISTDYVFDGEASIPYSETDTENPQGIYGCTKLQGEKNCMAENPDSIIIRTSWLYSSHGNNFVKTMLKLGQERDQLNVVFDQIGSPTYAADLATFILYLLRLAKTDTEKLIPGIYHFSNEGVASWFDFAKAIFEFSKIECNVLPIVSSEFPTLAKRPSYSVLNKSKIKNTFEVFVPYWRDSLKICIQKLRK